MFLCKVCSNYLKKGKLPPKASANCLEVLPIPESVHLQSYLEEALIARVLLFIKIFTLKSSLMPAMKDKCVVIPLDKKDIQDTMDSLPRLPSESGIIDIQWKRRVGQKNAHLQAKVDPSRIFNALQFLKDSGNPHYSNTQTREEYESRCQNEDPVGFNIIFGEEEPDTLQMKFIQDGSAEPMLELPKYLELVEEQNLEQQYQEHDAVRKFQIDYDENICMVERFPEAMQIEGVILPPDDNMDDPNQLHIVAPGEGKTPISLIYCKDWDAKAFPMLHPDGKNHLSDDGRERKLQDNDYFKQRICNTDPRWRNNPHYVFAAAVYREKKDLQRNIDLGYKKGKKNTGQDGKTQYTLKDPYSVFQNVANTPAYHKKGKMEMMARLDNFGAFHVFFTVSCADYRWPENLMAILRERGIDLRCSIDSFQKESYEVFSDTRGWVTMEDYTKNEMDETLHEVMRRNVVTATRNYQARVQALIQTIVRNPSNPLSVKHFSSKLEFQARGAGHHHGVLWLDIDKIEQKVDMRQLQEDNSDGPGLSHHLNDPSKVQDKLDKFLKDRNIIIEKTGKPKRKHTTLKFLEKYLTKERESECSECPEEMGQNTGDEEQLPTTKKTGKLNEREKNLLQDLKALYPLYGLKASLNKIHNGEESSEEELATVVKFVDTFSTVNLHPAIVGSIVAEIAKKVNQHHHTKTCKKYKTVCRFKMPKLPSKRTIIARPPGQNVPANVKKAMEAKHATVIKKVREILDNKEEMKAILEQYPKESETTEAEAIGGRTKRIDAVLNKAGLTTNEDKDRYEAALAYSSSGFTIVMARDVDELYINSYNPEITRAWDGNTDFQICLDFFAIITYITEYYAKDDTGIVKILVDTLKASDSTELREQMKLLMNTWIKNRQMGEAEAVYRLLKDFHFRESDAKCVFIQTCPRNERSKILKNVTNKPEYNHIPKVTVENHKEGEYIENYDIISKYERRPIEDHPDLDHLSLSQMVKMYNPFWGNKSEDQPEDENEAEEGQEVEPRAGKVHDGLRFGVIFYFLQTSNLGELVRMGLQLWAR